MDSAVADDVTVYSPATSQLSLPSEFDATVPERSPSLQSLSESRFVIETATPSRPSMLEPGIYSIISLSTGSVVDLHGGDNRSIIGFSSHPGDNQKWEFIPLGAGYMIRCIRFGLYLAPTALCNGGAVIATEYPVSWKVEVDQNRGLVQICWPNSPLRLDIREGSATPGTPIQLHEDIGRFEPNLWWRLVKLAAPTQRIEYGPESVISTTTITTVTTNTVSKPRWK